MHIIDVFGGGANIALNCLQYPGITYNDIDGDVCNFFRTLRDDPDELINQIQLTPYSREELQRASENCDDPLERARRFYIRVRQSRNGLAAGTSGVRWRRMTRVMPRVPVGHSWGKAPKELLEVAGALGNMQIENHPYQKIIEDFDSPHNFFYCDPPYVPETRGGKAYAHEMTREDHVEFGQRLQGLQARVMVSGYRCSLYDELFDSKGWRRIDAPARYIHSSPLKATEGAARTESVWLNYNPPNKGRLL